MLNIFTNLGCCRGVFYSIKFHKIAKVLLVRLQKSSPSSLFKALKIMIAPEVFDVLKNILQL